MTRDQVYLRHILESIERIESYASVGKKEYLKNTHWQDAIIRNFEVIGEASNLDYSQKYPYTIQR